MTAAVKVEGLSKQYRIGQFQPAYGTLRDSLTHGFKNFKASRVHEPPETIWALRDVSFEAQEGEVLGIIGANGAGKSTLLKILTRITTPTEGRAELRGRVGSLLEVGTGFHPELTGRENIYLNGSILGMTRGEIARNFDAIVEFSGVQKFIDTPVKRYSSGMSFASPSPWPCISSRRSWSSTKCSRWATPTFSDGRSAGWRALVDSGRTVLFVSHNLQGIMQLCDRTILLGDGQIVREGPTPDVVSYYEEQTMGTTAQLLWDDPLEAPGNDLIRLDSVRVIDEAGELATTIDVRHPVGIQLGFEGPAPRQAGRPQGQDPRSTRGDLLQRNRPEPALASAHSARPLRLDRVDSRKSAERRTPCS